MVAGDWLGSWARRSLFIHIKRHWRLGHHLWDFKERTWRIWAECKGKKTFLLPPSTAEVSTVRFGEPSIYVLYKNFSRSCHLRRNVSCLRHPGVARAQPWRPTCFPPSTYPLITHILHYIRRLTYSVPFIHSRRWSTTSLRCESWPRRCSKRTIMHQKTSKPRRNFWTEAVGALPCAWTGEEISFWRHSSSTRVLGRWGSL